MPSTICLLFDHPIERGEPANDTQHKFLAETTIGAKELREGLTEKRIGGNRFVCPFAKNASGDFSWFLPRHATTIAAHILPREPFRGGGAVSNDA